MKAKRWQYWTATGFPGIDNNQTALLVKAENKTAALKLAHEAQAILGIAQDPLLVLNNISVATLDDSDYVAVLSTGEGAFVETDHSVTVTDHSVTVGNLIDQLKKIQIGSNALEIIDEAINLTSGTSSAAQPRALKHINDSQLIKCLETLLKARTPKH